MHFHEYTVPKYHPDGSIFFTGEWFSGLRLSARLSDKLFQQNSFQVKISTNNNYDLSQLSEILPLIEENHLREWLEFPETKTQHHSFTNLIAAIKNALKTLPTQIRRANQFLLQELTSTQKLVPDKESATSMALMHPTPFSDHSLLNAGEKNPFSSSPRPVDAQHRIDNLHLESKNNQTDELNIAAINDTCGNYGFLPICNPDDSQNPQTITLRTPQRSSEAKESANFIYAENTLHTFFNFLLYIAFIELAENNQNILIANSHRRLKYVSADQTNEYEELLRNLKKSLNPEYNPNIHSACQSLINTSYMINSDKIENDFILRSLEYLKHHCVIPCSSFYAKNEPFTLRIPAKFLKERNIIFFFKY